MRGRIRFFSQVMLKHILFINCHDKNKTCILPLYINLPDKIRKYVFNKQCIMGRKERKPSKSSSSKSISSSSSSSDSSLTAAPFCWKEFAGIIYIFIKFKENYWQVTVDMIFAKLIKTVVSSVMKSFEGDLFTRTVTMIFKSGNTLTTSVVNLVMNWTSGYWLILYKLHSPQVLSNDYLKF